jgi:hypothetical protein
VLRRRVLRRVCATVGQTALLTIAAREHPFVSTDGKAGKVVDPMVFATREFKTPFP